MWTSSGLAFAATAVRERMGAATIEVADGQGESAQADAAVTVTGATIVLSADFGEDEASFEWRERRVLAQDGTVLDEELADQGRKAPGAIWTVEVTLDVEQG